MIEQLTIILKRIRKKFKNADNNFKSIVTIYGGGYKFSE